MVKHCIQLWKSVNYSPPAAWKQKQPRINRSLSYVCSVACVVFGFMYISMLFCDTCFHYVFALIWPFVFILIERLRALPQAHSSRLKHISDSQYVCCVCQPVFGLTLELVFCGKIPKSRNPAKFRFFCQSRGYGAIWGVFLGWVGEARFFT